MEIFERYRELLNMCFDEPPQNVPEIWMKKIQSRFPVDILSVEAGGEVVGCLTVAKRGDHIYSIEWIVVHPDYQQQGYGRELIEKVFGAYDGLFFVKSSYAPDFYQKCGFTLLKEKEGSYLFMYCNDMDILYREEKP